MLRNGKRVGKNVNVQSQVGCRIHFIICCGTVSTNFSLFYCDSFYKKMYLLGLAHKVILQLEIC